MFVEPIIGYGLTASAVVVLAIQLLKSLGVSIDAAPWVTLLLSVIAMLVAWLVVKIPDFQQFVDIVLGAILVYFTAKGIYHTGKDVAVHTGLSTGTPPTGSTPQV